MSSKVVGRTLGRLVAHELGRSAADGGGPKILVSNFSRREVREAIEHLEGHQVSGASGPVDIVVASDDPSDIPERFRLATDRSLTWHRNNSSNGLVLVLLTDTTDRQGLGQMFRITDRSILERRTDGSHAAADLLVEQAWDEAGTAGVTRPPEILVAELARVLDGVGRSEPMPLRPWARYVADTCSALRRLGRAVDVAEVRTALGSRLGALGLFPHDGLFDEPARVERHLERNRHMAQGRNPAGRQVPDDYVMRRIELVEHVASDGSPLSGADLEAVRALMRRFAEHLSEDARLALDYVQWARLFDSAAKREGLGTQIRAYLDEHEGGLLQMFDDFDVQGALDEGDHEAATTLLDAETFEGATLADVLPSPIRRRIEKLAVPPASFEGEPLRAVLRYIVGGEFAPDATIALRLDPAQGRTGVGSLLLFALLYGRTLADVAEQSALGDGRRFILEEGLADVVWPDPRRPEDEEEPEDPWTPVHLALWDVAEESPRQRFRWSPPDRDGLAAFAALVRGHAPPPGLGSTGDLESWAAELTLALSEEQPSENDAVPSPGPAGEWSTARARHLAAWAAHGLDAERLDRYVDAWSELLYRAREELVPVNSPMPELDAWLDMDMMRLAEGRVALLATHPLRMRWFAAHLGRLAADLVAALEGRFTLNPENDTLYFESISRVSPYRQPPVVVAGADEVLASTREFGLHEEYAPAHRGNTAEAWVGAVDEGAVRVLAGTVASYLDAFPHKADGLALLILSRDGDERLPELLAREVRRGHRGRLVLEIHVVAPRWAHRAIAARFRETGGDADREAELLPGTRLIVHDWPEQFESLLEGLSGRIDVALVPNLFGAQTQLQPKTRPAAVGVGGRFDPWLDASSHTAPVSGGKGENVSRILLPGAPDPLLEAWATLSVRRYQRSPVAPDSPANTDYFTLQVTFDRNRALFEKLHEIAHWVVTLDPFVGRDQIDALESPPDVILVRSGVGKNETHTLVVSSKAGRDFVIRGLDRKLRRNLGLVGERDSPRIAERLYDLGRNTVPGVMLRALGLGRSLEEIVGLVVTRFAVQEHFPTAEERPGIEWWLSLDEHLSWFGGAHQMRADLMRVSMWLRDERAVLELQVIESKFRRNEDIGVADKQLLRSTALLEAALMPSIDGQDHSSDSNFWRREVAAALDETSRRHAPLYELPPLRLYGSNDDTLLQRLRERLLIGDYELRISGVACALATHDLGSAAVRTTPAGFPLLRMPRSDILRVLGEIDAAREPQPRVPDVAEAVAPHTDDWSGSDSEGGGSDRISQDPAGLRVPADGDPAEPDPQDEVRPALGEVANGRGMASSVLEDRYQRVLDALNEFNIAVSAPDGLRYEQGPGFYLLRAVPGAGVAADKLMNRATDLKLRLGLPAEHEIRTYADRGAVVFEVPKQPDERYPVQAEDLWARALRPDGHLSVPVGEDIAGDVVSIDFSSSDTPHLLIAGTTGSGKSVALEAILRGLASFETPERLRLHLVDPKGTELVGFEGDEHLSGLIGMDGADAIELLQRAVEEMQRRYGLFKPARVRDLPAFNAQAAHSDRLPWWVVVLDEYADLTADPDEKREIEQLLKRLAQKARAAGIHLIIATQRPSVDVISPVVRANLPAQLALRVRNASDSRVILGEAGAEALAGSGDALLRTGRGIVRIQCGMANPAGA